MAGLAGYPIQPRNHMFEGRNVKTALMSDMRVSVQRNIRNAVAIVGKEVMAGQVAVHDIERPLATGVLGLELFLDAVDPGKGCLGGIARATYCSPCKVNYNLLITLYIS